MHARLVQTLALALCIAFSAWAVPDTRTDGAELTAAFYEGRIDSVWQRMSPQMQGALKSRDGLAAFRRQVGEQLGAERAVVEETTSSAQGYRIYLRRARFEKVPMVVLVQWAIDAEGRVGGFFIRPDASAAREAAPSEHLDHRTRTSLRLPFDEAFFVFWGGRSVEENHHAVDRNQGFALDFLAMREDRSHVGDGTRNEDYHCFGKPIVAPAGGKVVEAIDGVADNVPGRTNPGQITGNRVVLDHGNGEYSVLAHLRQGSLRVRAGDVVAAGDRLGDCGNSGNSTEPHLHYQLQDGPRFGDSAGLPAQFQNFFADGKAVARGEPTRGQHVRPVIEP